MRGESLTDKNGFGLIPLSVKEIFRKTSDKNNDRTFKITVSYLEVRTLVVNVACRFIMKV